MMHTLTLRHCPGQSVSDRFQPGKFNRSEISYSNSGGDAMLFDAFRRMGTRRNSTKTQLSATLSQGLNQRSKFSQNRRAEEARMWDSPKSKLYSAVDGYRSYKKNSSNLSCIDKRKTAVTAAA